MLNTFEVNKVLIIAPLRVARDTWPAEIEKWDHLKNLDISIVVGDVKTRIAAVHHPAMIYVVNRENVKWLVEYYEKNGMRWDFSMVVIDELSSFKNYQSQRFKFLRKVRPYVKRWVGLTGTPSSNGLMDLWAEIGILDGGERLGKFIGRYREAYFKAASMNPSSGVVFQYTRMTEKDVSVDAPKVTTQEQRKTILNAVTWKYDWIQQNKKRCFRFAEAIIARQKNGGTKNLQESRFMEDFIQYAATLPEPNRRVLDMMYEAAWHIICIYRFGMTRDQVPEPWYDTVSEVRKNGKEHADGKC